MKRLLSLLFLGVNAFVGALWLAGFAAAYINPTDYWIGGVLAVGLPFVTVVLIPFAVGHAVSRRWVALVVHLVVVVLAINRHWSIDRLDRPEARKSDLTLMTFNSPRFPETELAVSRVNAMVKGVRPDMIGLQESVVWASKSEPQNLRTHTKFRAVVDSMGYATTPPRYGPEGVSWVRWLQPLLSLKPIASQEQFTFGRDIPGWPTMHLTRSEIEFEGRRLAHYNVHLITYGPSKPWNGDGDWLRLDRWTRYLSEVRIAFRVRSWQAERIRELMDADPLPKILSGDFNGTADNWSYRHLSRGFNDAFRSAGSGWGGTYHAKYPFLRIDFVLLGPEFEAVRARVPGEYETVSDHRPLVVRFRWKDTV